MNPAIEVIGVTKKFKRRTSLLRYIFKKEKKEKIALDNVNLTIKEGELFGLLGPNGAGKTTLVRCIATLLIPDKGEIRILGKDISKNPNFARRNIGLLTSGERTLYWKLSAIDNLRFFAALYGLSGKERDKRIDFLLELLELKDFADERVEKYSSGMKQKLSLARALLHDPKILLLDEPTLGLDPAFARFIRNFIKEELIKKQRKTILLTTHYMDEADELCEEIAFIHNGKIIDVKTPEEFKKSIPHKDVLEIRFLGFIEKEDFQKISGVENFTLFSENGIWTAKFICKDTEVILNDILSILNSKKCKILSVVNLEPTLEDVFIYHTGKSLKEDTTEKL
ncbi:MAG: ABC transporter ATP-binding protein [candidate division WOR-3 bacterium]|nr:ABC transporter ATP-binding protein [candidate division WOR-3 bacterium]MCX7837535.1 ABC transporter ATP-binding protein [candidate division WOR-3 bacterium]MDW8113969.1 ABC transporter ATP-binding protein [candidate division WOR-3 bacterium]